MTTEFRINLKIEAVNKNKHGNPATLIYEFKTVDAAGNFVFAKKRNAVRKLLNFLVDKSIMNPGEEVWDLLRQDYKHGGLLTRAIGEIGAAVIDEPPKDNGEAKVVEKVELIDPATIKTTKGL